MRLEQTILHINVADFGVAVERVEDCCLRGWPLIIASQHVARSVVYDMSEEAYHSGVRKGMRLTRALRYCRDATVLPPRFDVYRRAMAALIKHANHYSPRLEHGLVDGHIFVDITGTHRLFGPPPDIGWKFRNGVRKSLGIDPIWSIGSSKLVAKVASRLVKPVGEYIVGTGEEGEFLAPLSVCLLPGISVLEMRRIRELNLNRIGELARLSSRQLMVLFGGRGMDIYGLCRGVDKERIAGGNDRDQVICREHQFDTDTNDRQQVRSVVADMVTRAAAELRANRLTGKRIRIRVDYSDGTTKMGQAVGKGGSSDNDVLLELASLALRRAWSRRTRLRGCTLLCDRLHRASTQLPLFPECGEKKQRRKRVAAAVDTIRARFGHSAVRTAA